MKFNLFLLLRKDLEQSMPKGNTLNSKWLFKGYSLYSITHFYYSSKKKLEKRHQRNMTYPMGGQTSPQKAIQDTLPPPLSGCNCSMCNTVQSLGAMTFGSNTPMLCKGHISRYGNQVLYLLQQVLFQCVAVDSRFCEVTE